MNDVNPETYCIDTASLLSKVTSRTKAIVIQHTFGIPAPVDDALTLAKERGLVVIEDCCHAFGSKRGNTEVGQSGHAAFFSSQWTKPVTTGLGGWARVRDRLLAERMAALYRDFAFPSLAESFRLRLEVFLYGAVYRPELFWLFRDFYRLLGSGVLVIGSSSSPEASGRSSKHFAKRMSGWQMRLLDRKLRRYAGIVAHRRRIAEKYDILLRQAGLKGLDLPSDCDPVLLRYPLLVGNKTAFLEEAHRRRVEIGDWFVSPIHPTLDNWTAFGYEPGSCPVGEMLSRHIVNLPTHERIGEAEFSRVANLVRQFAG